MPHKILAILSQVLTYLALVCAILLFVYGGLFYDYGTTVMNLWVSPWVFLNAGIVVSVLITLSFIATCHFRKFKILLHVSIVTMCCCYVVTFLLTARFSDNWGPIITPLDNQTQISWYTTNK